MKKLSILKAFLAASALALLVPGCSGIDGGYETAVENSSNIKNGKVALNLSIGDGYASLRTALPSAEDIALSQYTYALSAKSGEAEKIYLFGSATEGIEYAKAISVKAAYIEEGTYDFELIAFKEGKAILAGVLNGKEITATSNTLSFRMYAADSDSQTGSLAITVTYPTDMGVAVTSTTAENETTITAVPGVKAELFSDASCSGTGTALSVIGTGNDGAFETGKVLVAATDISAGKSFVKITLSDGTETIGSAVEAVYAVEGMVSSSEVAVEAEKFLATVKLQDATIATAKEIKVKAVVDGAEKGDFISLSVVDGSDNKNYQAYLTAGLSYNVYVGDAKKDGVVISDVTTKEFYAEKDLSAIEIAWASGSAPTDLYVNQTDLNDVLLGLINVTKKYSNGESDTPVLANTLDATLTVTSDSTAEQTVNVTLDGKTAATGLALTLNADELDSIAVTQVPTNVSYKQNESFAPAGMKITATYKSKNEDEYVFTDNGITKNDVALDGDSPFSFSPENFRATTFADSEDTANVDVTISMIDGSVTKTATQTVTVTKINEMLPYEFDLTTLSSLITDNKDTYVREKAEAIYNKATILASTGTGNVLRIRANTNYVNYVNGNYATITAPEVDTTVADNATFYIGVDLSKIETLATKALISFNFNSVGSDKAGNKPNGFAFIINTDGKVLAVLSDIDLSASTPYSISVNTTELTSKLKLYFSRANAGGGGLNITGITVIDPDKIQSAPDATKFNTVSATLNADDGKITVSELLTNENGAKLEYKLSSATEWTEATASIENLAAGVYEFRYAALSDGSKSASPSVSVTVFGAKSLELDSALYTITPKVDGGVVSATTTIATVEVSEGKVSVTSVAAGSSVITITDTYGNSEELTVTVSAIGTITAKSTKALGKIKATDSVAVTSSGKSSLTVAKDDVVSLTATPTIAAANPEKLTYQWYKKVGDEEVSEIDGATSAIYTVPTSDVGTVFYSVKVKGTISTEVEITSEKFSVNVVDSLTKITAETVVTISSSAESSVEEGTKVTLTASINGYDASSWEAVTYQWYKKVGEAEAVAIESATSVTYEYTTTADDVTASPTFIVTVTGASSDVSVTSSAVTISVEKKRVDVQKSQTINNGEVQLGFVATSVESSDGSVATVEITEDGIVITSVTAGEATITCSADGKEATIAVTVKQTGDITIKVTKYRNITALVAVDEGSYDVTQTGIFVTNSAGTDKQSTDSRFLASCQINTSGLNLKGEDYPVFFRVESKMILTFTDSNSKGLVIYEVTGSGKKKSETALENKETAPKYKYELPAGMYEIVGTSAGTGKIASLNFESAVFTASSETVDNSEEKLGLAATSATSSDPDVVKVAEDVSGGIVITSVKKGSATITCKDAEGHEATIAVTVSGSGAITVGTITKYVAEGSQPAVSADCVVAGTYAMTIAGGYTKQDANAATQKVNNISVSAKVETSDVVLKISSSAQQGTVSFTVGSTMTLVVTDSSSNGIAIASTDGTATVDGTTVSLAALPTAKNASANIAGKTMTLTAGTYELGGCSTGGSKLTQLVFANEE